MIGKFLIFIIQVSLFFVDSVFASANMPRYIPISDNNMIFITTPERPYLKEIASKEFAYKKAYEFLNEGDVSKIYFCSNYLFILYSKNYTPAIRLLSEISGENIEELEVDYSFIDNLVRKRFFIKIINDH